jgi:glutaredoxin/glutathione-dependent peroxiredoxin
MIQIGPRMPAGRFAIMGRQGPEPITAERVFSGKKVALFSVPGAFTPTCSAKHLPGFIAHSAALQAAGIDTIACMAVNDAYVMAAWGDASGAGDAVLMLADGNGDYTRALGLEMDASKFDMGIRGKRFSMLVDDGVVRRLNVEAAGEFKVSSAEQLLEQMFR